MWAEVFLPAAAVSLVLSLLLVLTRRRHGRLTDDPPQGIQKLHHRPTPRVGGVALFAGLAAGAWVAGGEAGRLAALLGLVALPAFAAGLAEDLTKRLPVALRLVATLTAGLALVLLTGLRIDRLDLPGIDLLLGLAPLAAGLTVIAVGGMANAVNIIDGVNGLATGLALIVLAAVAAIALQAGDPALARLCLLTAGAVAGVFVVNFPAGRLFLGDGGAYLIGVVLAALVLLLPARNPGISPLVGLLLLSFPVAETLSSVQRRWSRRRGHPGCADRLHLHSLIHRGAARRLARQLGHPALRNPVTGAALWAFPLAAAGVAVAAPGNTALNALAVAMLWAGYGALYRRVALLGRRALPRRSPRRALAQPA